MASMTSVISFFFLLFVTYSYSLPVVQKSSYSTPRYPSTTGTTTVEHGQVASMELISDEESTGVPNFHKFSSGYHSSSGPSTTSKGVTFSPRELDEDFSSTTESTNSDESNEKRSWDEYSSTPQSSTPDESNEKRSWEEYSSSTPQSSTPDESNEKRSWNEYSLSTPQSSTPDESNEKRSWGEYSSTTMETSSEFDRRALKSFESQEEPETSTLSSTEHPVGHNQQFESSSSVNSFGQFTGLLHDGQSSTTESQQPDQSTEESSTRFYSQYQQPQKTISIIPGKITETRIYTNVEFPASSIPTDVEKRVVARGPKNPSRGIPGPNQQLPRQEVGR